MRFCKILSATFFALIALDGALAGKNPLPIGMQQLCAEATTKKFTPDPASLKSPNPNKIFNLVEMGGGYRDVLNALGDQHPDKVIFYALTPKLFSTDEQSKYGVTPMMAAALVGNWDAALALINRGANLNYKAPPIITTTPLESALLGRKFSFACKLIEHGAEIPLDKANRDSLFGHVLTTFPEEREQAAIFIDFFMRNGFDPNDVGSSLETPVMRAVALNNVQAIKVLLNYGARLDIVKKDGKTVWSVANKKNNPEVLKLLKEAEKKAKAAEKVESRELVRQ
jgi:uncharacterized protein